jgi:LCP family protein required for cell wall assembly
MSHRLGGSAPRQAHGPMTARPRRSTRRRRWPWLVVLAALIGLAAVVGRYVSNPAALLATPQAVQHNRGIPGFQHRVTLLFLGSSLETAAHHDLTGRTVRNRADTLMVFSLDLQTHRVGVLSIPRDTRVDLPGVGPTKIAECTFFGGASLCAHVIEATFHVPVDYYAYLSMFALPRIINAVGGLTLDIPRNEVYEPQGDPLGIDLPQGVHHLNGQQVLEFVRYRNTAQGDIARIAQQQEVIRALVQKLLRPGEIPHWPAIAALALHSVTSTNLTVPQLLAWGALLRNLNPSTVAFATLPGHASVHRDPVLHEPLDYWTYDPRLASWVVASVLGRGSAGLPPRLSAVVDSGTASLAPAQAVAARLRALGVRVRAVGWANHHNHRRSVLVNTTGDGAWGTTLIRELHLGPTVQDVTAYHTTPWDLRIVVGSAYRPATAAPRSSGATG